MPSLLALDTATDACTLAIYQEINNFPQVVEKTIVSPRQHTQQLLPLIEALLQDCSLALNDLDAIAYGCGPGSFTGLRIGLSVAQGLAYGVDLPLLSVSTLKTMAATAIRLAQLSVGTLVVPVLDARMNEVYWSVYFVEEDYSLRELQMERVGSAESCVQSIQSALGNAHSLQGLGSGWCYPLLNSLSIPSSVETKVDQTALPSAHDLSLLAAVAYQQQLSVEPQNARLNYVREQVSWQKRQRIRT